MRSLSRTLQVITMLMIISGCAEQSYELSRAKKDIPPSGGPASLLSGDGISVTGGNFKNFSFTEKYTYDSSCEMVIRNDCSIPTIILPGATSAQANCSSNYNPSAVPACMPSAFASKIADSGPATIGVSKGANNKYNLNIKCSQGFTRTIEVNTLDITSLQASEGAVDQI